LAREEAAGEISKVEMRFWDFLFGKTVKIGDAFFGEMVFIEISTDPSKSYFECERYFKPSGEKIGLSVTGSLSGPTQRQKNFFAQIETEYLLLVPRWTTIIEQEFSSRMLVPVIRDFAKEFKPGYLSIPTCQEQPIEWEITFDTIHDLNHIITVGMLADEPQYVQVDG
jgi:hypothetical protein